MASHDDEKWNSRLVLAAASSIFVALAWPAFGRRIYVQSDLLDAFLPMRTFYSHALKTGGKFIWWPDIFTGYYLHGDGAPGLFHPLNLAGYAWLPLDAAFNLELLRNYPLLFVGTFLLLRRWEIRKDAALFGALVFTFSGFNLLHHLHPNAVATVAHLPWLLWTSDLSLRQPPRTAALAALGFAVLLASGLLHGYPQYMLYSGMVWSGYVFLLLRRSAEPGRLLRLLLLAACGMALAGVQLLPTLASLANSLRAERSLGLLYSFSLEPINLAQLAAPYVFSERVVGGNPHEFGVYAGAALPALCVWLWLRGRQLGSTHRLALAAGILGAISLVLALGEYGYLYTLQVKIPLLDLFRAPCRYIVLVHFSSAVLAAVAFDDLAKQRAAGPSAKRLWYFALPPILTAVALGAAWAWQQSGAEPPGTLNSALPLFGGAALVLLATGLVVLAARGHRHALLGLITLVGLDLGIYGLSYINSEAPDDIASITQKLDRGPAEPGDRVRTSGNYPSLLGLRNAGGYVAMRPERSLGMGVWHASEADDSRIAAFRLMGISWVRVPPWNRKDGGDNRWVEVQDPMPRARLVPTIALSENTWTDIAHIDIRLTALVSKRLNLPGGAPGSAVIRRDQPGSLEVETEAGTRQLLVISESHHPGWTARIDGQPADMIVAYGDFIGCVVEAGHHRVELDFDPADLRRGTQLSAAGLVAALALTGTTLFRRRRA